MKSEPTHRLVKTIRISARFLADFMSGSETAKRTIVRDCKYKSTARVIQHDEAKEAISHFMLDRGRPEILSDAEAGLRARIADTDFERDLYDHNAEYIARFTKIHQQLLLPKAEIMPSGLCPFITLRGVVVTVDISFRLQRVARTNKIRTGAAMLRYAKGKALASVVSRLMV